MLVLTGDGSLLINIQELATIAENNLDIKICVFNNGHLGLVRQQQELFYGRRYVASRFDARPDFAAIARGFGIPGCTIRMPHDGEALARALAIEGPVLLDIELPEAENVYPMVPPGKSNIEAIVAPEAQAEGNRMNSLPNTIVKLTVNNHPGAMSHITGLFSRRGFNLEGILCAPVDGGAAERHVPAGAKRRTGSNRS